MFQKFFFPVVLFISIFLLSFYRLYAQEEEGDIIIISERVGEVIDQEERIKYHIFPGITGFQSAVLFRLSDLSYVFKITYLDEKTDEKKTKLMSQTELQIMRIKEHINQFE